MSSIMRRRNGLMAWSIMGMLLSGVRLGTPYLQTGRARYRPSRAPGRSALPRERFSPLALFGRRPPKRVDGLVIPASENLHNSGHPGTKARGGRELQVHTVAASHILKKTSYGALERLWVEI